LVFVSIRSTIQMAWMDSSFYNLQMSYSYNYVDVAVGTAAFLSHF
jgi:hypothetical protein